MGSFCLSSDDRGCTLSVTAITETPQLARKISYFWSICFGVWVRACVRACVSACVCVYVCVWGGCACGCGVSVLGWLHACMFVFACRGKRSTKKIIPQVPLSYYF